MSAIPNFNDSELWTVQSTLKEHYGRDIEAQLAEADVRLSRHTADMSSCPTLYWEADDGCHFGREDGSRALSLPVFLSSASDAQHRYRGIRQSDRMRRHLAADASGLCHQTARERSMNQTGASKPLQQDSGII